MTTYPARIAFQIDEPRRRTRVIAAAKQLGLTLEDLGNGSFVVIVPDAETAYQLGWLSADEAPA